MQDSFRVAKHYQKKVQMLLKKRDGFNGDGLGTVLKENKGK